MATIFLSIPVMDRPEMRMMTSMYNALFTSIFANKKHKIIPYFNEGDSLISRARNEHISAFINEFKQCDYFMSIDSDIEIMNVFADNNIFDRLVAHDLDFVGGLYSLKRAEGPVESSSVMLDGKRTADFDSGLVEMKFLSSGCWCLKRSAIEKMILAYSDLWYDGEGVSAGKKNIGLYIPFIADLETTGFDGSKIKYKKYLSEDWAFCSRWLNIGGKIFADTGIALKHYGKYPYTLWNLNVQAYKKSELKLEEKLRSIEEKKKDNRPQTLPLPGFNL